MNLENLTIIVPTKNEEKNIKRFLDSIPPGIPLIVIDASDDRTPEIVVAARPGGTRILWNPGNIATARQQGADIARTEWLLYTDADMMFAPDYFEQLQSMNVSSQVGGISGAKSSCGRFRIYYACFSAAMAFLCRVGIPAASGSNMLVRRRALVAAGGFDKRLDCNEDSELIWKIQTKGFKVIFNGKLSVFEMDHRRLEQGACRKTLHSIFRCFLLFSGLLPDAFRGHNWGYWKHREERQTQRSVLTSHAVRTISLGKNRVKAKIRDPSKKIKTQAPIFGSTEIMRTFGRILTVTALLTAVGYPMLTAGPARTEPPMAPTHTGTFQESAPRVEIFSSPSCKYCVMAKQYFQEKGIQYITYNVSKGAVAAARMYPLNPRGMLPFVIFNGKAVVGFVPEAYEKLLSGS